MADFTFDIGVIEQQFLGFMRLHGCEAIGGFSFVADGKIHRFPVQGDRHGEKSGAYCVYLDNWPAGFVQNWRTGVKEIWHFSRDNLTDEGKSWFDDERYREACRRSAEHQKALAEQRALEQKKATLEAAKLWQELNSAPDADFPYLHRKHVAPHGIKLRLNFNAIMYGNGYKEGELVIPLRNINGDIQTLQFIDPDGGKKFFTDAPVKGAFFSIGFEEALLLAHQDWPILIAEGYATAATIFHATGFPTVAAMNAGNIFPVAEAIKGKFPHHKIIIMADNDFNEAHPERNVGMDKANEAYSKLHLQAVIAPEFDAEADGNGSDWNDFEALYGFDKTQTILQDRIHKACLSDEMKAILKKVVSINAQELRTKKFNPVKWVVPGLIPTGLTVLAAPPKTGKSLFGFHLSIASAIGGCALGKIDVPKGDVLYLALEDTERRLQERILGSDIPEDCDLSRLTFTTECPRQDEGGMKVLRDWLQTHKNASLIFIDTLQKFRKLSNGKLNVYAEDYECMSQLKKLADEFNVAIVVIHHLKKTSRKSMIEDDWLTQLSGSMAISGAADTILILDRPRTSTHGTLKITGRDVEEKELSLKLDGFGWCIEGDKSVLMPSWKKVIYDYLKTHEYITPGALSDEAHISIEAARKQLQRACDDALIKRLEHGMYALNE